MLNLASFPRIAPVDGREAVIESDHTAWFNRHWSARVMPVGDNWVRRANTGPEVAIEQSIHAQVLQIAETDQERALLTGSQPDHDIDIVLHAYTMMELTSRLKLKGLVAETTTIAGKKIFTIHR
jgi:hypothetical protein